jgi:hypothetical protein
VDEGALGWLSGKKGADDMGTEGDEVGEGTDNRPDASLVGRYMVVPKAHFALVGGVEAVKKLEEDDGTPQVVARITHYLRPTPVKRPYAMYKSFVDHPGSNQIRTYTFNAAQVVAYIQPVAFEPEEDQRANLVLDREWRARKPHRK